MTAASSVLTAVRDHREKHGNVVVDDFLDLLALPNVTGDLPALQRNAAELVRRFTEHGAELRTVVLPGAAPVVVGRLPGPHNAPRLGVYVHYDGQPVDPERWETPPFTPTIRHGRIYARGAADDKAPFAALLGAIQALGAAGIERSVELVFLFEGQEESGSPDLSRYMEMLRDELRTDLWLICDGPIHPSGRPQVVFGVRGYCGFELTVYGPERELHSGHFGNWVPNPALDLVQLLATCKDAAGNVLIAGFSASTRPVTAADLAANAALPPVEEQYRTDLGFAAAEPAAASYAGSLLRPSFNIRGLRAGDVGDAARNAIPAHATASVDMRLAAGNDPAAMVDLVRDHIIAQGYVVLGREPTDAERRTHRHLCRFTPEIGYPAARASVETAEAAPIVAAAGAAGSGGVVRVPTFGGSVPLHHFNEILDVPVLLLPMANYDNNQHGPNENLTIDSLWYGIRLWSLLLSGATRTED